MPEYEIRQATGDDAAALEALSHECFGYPPGTPRDPNRHGRSTWVALADGAIVATVADIAYESWWWGSKLPTAGIASVKVAAEFRGSGLMRRLFDTVLESAVARGAIVSTLYPTAPGIYRSLGYEVVGAYDDEVELPTAALRGVRPGSAELVRADEADLPTLRRLYDEWASGHNGPLVRDGSPFPTQGALADVQVTMARDEAHQPRGYVIWDREGGYSRPEATLRVHDFVALDADAARSLIANLATNASVAPRTLWATSGVDLPHRLVPEWPWQIIHSHPYMLTVLDVPRALESRVYPATLTVLTTFAVDDDVWQLSVRDSQATVTRGDGEPTVRFTKRGFALVWSGAASLHSARLAGLARGDDSSLDVLTGGREVHIRDYF